ncbi:transposase [Nonomuraea sp. SBT364]|uniref:transposase n=1 Tax=Nonomuraea sp. SBT364 TaxID=1580530 RepID=UPI0012E2034E
MRVPEVWEQKCPVILRLWHSGLAQFVTFPAFDVEIRKAIYSTNAIWANARSIRRFR